MLKPVLVALALTTFGAASVYAQSTPPSPSAPAPTTQDQERTPPATSPRTTSPGAPAPRAAAPSRDFNADGHISTDTVIGTSVRNSANESIGKIEDVYVDKDGKIQLVVVSVGGFLGIGSKNVAVKWSDLQVTRDGNKLVLMSSSTKDTLKAMPDYTPDRQQAQQQ